MFYLEQQFKAQQNWIGDGWAEGRGGMEERTGEASGEVAGKRAMRGVRRNETLGGERDGKTGRGQM